MRSSSAAPDALLHGSGMHISSPPRQYSDVPEDGATPRASGQQTGGESPSTSVFPPPHADRDLIDSSPLRYLSSSSPFARAQAQVDHPSSSSGLFVRSSRAPVAGRSSQNLSRRSDIHSDQMGTNPNRHRLFVDENGNAIRGDVANSDAMTFSQLDPNTSDAQLLGGDSTRVIWGTNVSIQDTMSSFKSFLRNYTRKYRMWADGATEEETQAEGSQGDRKEYLDMLRNMRQLGVTGLNLDVRNLKAYPATLKLWFQIQSYPQEVIPLMDQTLKDILLDEVEREISENRARQQRPKRVANGLSSPPPFPSSSASNPDASGQTARKREEQDLIGDIESKIYKIRPFGLDQTINLRDLNPNGEIGLTPKLDEVSD